MSKVGIIQLGVVSALAHQAMMTALLHNLTAIEHNDTVKCCFAEEVKHRQTEREHTHSLTQGQRYILRELREMFKLTEDEDEKAQINLLEKAFRGSITTAINRELNLLRKNSVRGRDLSKTLGQIYFQHDMQKWGDNRSRRLEDDEVPRLICSEGLL